MNVNLLFHFLDEHCIEYTVYKHQPLFTTEDQPILIDSGDVTEMPGLHSKNLFLRDNKNAYYLVSVTQDKRVNLKELSNQLGCSRFSFGKPDELYELLKLTPGSVTPFGLLFDEHIKVSYVLDEDFIKADWVNFHPLQNDMTIGLRPERFLKVMELMRHVPSIMRIPE